jgi:capsid protein
VQGPAELDPRAEVGAAATRVAEGFSTRTAETRELTGGDFWSNHRLRAREEAARKADGLVEEPVAPAVPIEKTGADPEEAAA